MYQRFEHEYGFDGTHSICQQGAPISEAIQRGRDDGWSPVPAQPGLLGGKVKKAAPSAGGKAARRL